MKQDRILVWLAALALVGVGCTSVNTVANAEPQGQIVYSDGKNIDGFARQKMAKHLKLDHAEQGRINADDPGARFDCRGSRTELLE